MKIGALVEIWKHNIDAEFRRLHDMGLNCCQLVFWDTSMYTEAYANEIKAASKQYGIEITAIWAGWSGPMDWGFTYGPETIGLVPRAYRDSRLKELFAASDFLQMLGVTDMITHVGYLPERADDPDFVGTVIALRTLCEHLEKRGQYFLFEAGEETPVTLLRMIDRIGAKNIGINFDTANLISYGKGNSLDALDMWGKYVRNTHLKDSLYPATPDELGEEVKLGTGKANLPAILAKLKEIAYTGPYIIEREITGDEQTKDIIEARIWITSLLKDLGIE